jgi:hypothetical protein
MREAVEETGLEFADPPVLFHLYLNRKLENRDHVALFVARGVRQPRPPGPGAEILWTGFHAPDALPDDVTPATRRRIGEVLRGEPPPTSGEPQPASVTAQVLRRSRWSWRERAAHSRAPEGRSRWSGGIASRRAVSAVKIAKASRRLPAGR